MSLDALQDQPAATAVVETGRRSSEKSLEVEELAKGKGSQDSPLSEETLQSKRTPDDTATTFPTLDSENELHVEDANRSDGPANTSSISSSLLPRKRSTSGSSNSRSSATSSLLTAPLTPPSQSVPPVSFVEESKASSRSSPSKKSAAFFNPTTGYAPSRRKVGRREIMGMSIFAYDPQPESPPTYHQSDDDSASVSSLDSEQALERAARRIRLDLRLSEMAELAAEAERAAAAGHESFTGQPSTYGGKDVDLSDQDLEEDSQRTNSARRRLHPRFRRPRKVALTDLRVADDVFPSFNSFHSHLRTHFSRSLIDRKVLSHHEDNKREYGLPEDVTSSESMRIFGSFSFDKWMPGKRIPNRPQDPVAKAKTVGDIVAGHKHDPDSNLKIQRPEVEVPSGLIEQTEDLSASLNTGNASQSTTSSGRPADSTVSSDESSASQSMTVNQATPRQRNHTTIPDFVTPTRLRVIRGTSGTTPNETPPKDDTVHQPPNSILQKAPGFLPPPPDRTPLLLPDFSSKNESHRAIRLKPSTSHDGASETHVEMQLNIKTPPRNASIMPRRKRIQDNSTSIQKNPSFQDKHVTSDSDRLLRSPESARDYTLSSSGIPRSTSTETLEILKTSSEPWNLFIQRSNSTECQKKFEAALDKLTDLSPKSAGRIGSKNPAPVENDAFLGNFLYCSQPGQEIQTRGADATCSVDEAWRESVPCGIDGDLHVDVCCTSILSETALGWLPRRSSTHNKHIMLSRRAAEQSSTEGDSWFDVANEKFDGVVERFRSPPKAGSRWNVSFQAPSLNQKSARPTSVTKPRSNSVLDEGPQSKREEGNKSGQEEDSPPLSDNGTVDSRSETSSERHVHHVRHATMPTTPLVHWISHDRLLDSPIISHTKAAASPEASPVSVGEDIVPMDLSQSFDRAASP